MKWYYQWILAFDYITKRKTDDGLNEQYGVIFVSDDQSGIPYEGSYLNYPSWGISRLISRILS